MSRKQDYCIFPRKLQSGKIIYYYSYYDELNKRIYRSTGCETYKKAVTFCNKLLREERLGGKSSILLKDFVIGFYNRETCPISLRKEARGYKLSANTIEQKRIALNHHILPFIGDTELHRIYEKDIEDWLLLKKHIGFSHSYINCFLKTIREIFNYAIHRNLITCNPTENIAPFKKISREKGILTAQEAFKFLNGESTQALWSKAPFLKSFFLLAAATGMRLGEIQALHHDQIKKNGIVIDKSWSPLEGLKCTKNGKPRFISVHPQILTELKSSSNTDIGLVFASPNKLNTPISRRFIYKYFHKALQKIGIEKSTRSDRNLTFHSWRHYANTALANSGIATNLVMDAIGHESEAMHNHYKHLQTIPNRNFHQAQEHLIGATLC